MTTADMPRTRGLDAARETAWEALRECAWPEGRGTGAPGHEEGRRIIRAARRHASRCPGCVDAVREAIHTLDPLGAAYSTAIDLAWAARKANA